MLAASLTRSTTPDRAMTSRGNASSDLTSTPARNRFGVVPHRNLKRFGVWPRSRILESL